MPSKAKSPAPFLRENSGTNPWVVIPVANEEANLEQLAAAIAGLGIKGLKLCLVYDNYSTDSTPDLAKNLARKHGWITALFNPESTGAASCYLAGLKKALEEGAGCAVEMDSGFSHDPAQIPVFISKIREGYDCVFGSRMIPGGTMADLPLKRRAVSITGSLLARFALRTDIADMTSGYEAFSRKALERIAERDFISARSRATSRMFQTEIRFYLMDMKHIEAPITYRNSESTFSLKQVMVSLLLLAELAKERLKT